MTVDLISLPTPPIRPLPHTPWPPAGSERDRFDSDAAAAAQPRHSEPMTTWPRVFPGL